MSKNIFRHLAASFSFGATTRKTDMTYSKTIPCASLQTQFASNAIFLPLQNWKIQGLDTISTSSPGATMKTFLVFEEFAKYQVICQIFRDLQDACYYQRIYRYCLYKNLMGNW